MRGPVLASAMPAKKAARKAPTRKAAAPADRVQVRTPNVPGYTGSVDRTKYDAMRKVLLQAIPKGAGLTQSEMWDAARKVAPAEHWPGGAKVEWWVKCVQLDLEAQGVLKRDGGKPLRWSRA
jgi:hypothetical protein